MNIRNEIVNPKIISEFNQWIKISSAEEKVIRKETKKKGN